MSGTPEYPRDLIGYGPTPPHAAWPGDARIAVQFVLNYEEGGENAILHGDPASEAFLSEIIGAAPLERARPPATPSCIVRFIQMEVHPQILCETFQGSSPDCVLVIAI